MSKNTTIPLDVKTSTCDVFAYYAIPIEAFQSIVDEQTVSGTASLADNLVIGSLTEDDVFGVDTSSKYPDIIHLDNESAEIQLDEHLPTEEEFCTSDTSKDRFSDLKCLICKTTFTKLTQYRKHVLEHRNAKKFKCEQCNASYNMEDNFKLHMAIHSKGPPCCPLCDRKFQRMASLKAHLLVHQVDETIACIKCMTEFEKEEDLDAHMAMHDREESGAGGSGNHAELPLVCSYCNYSFDDTKAYREHVSYHVKIKKMILSRRKKRANIPKDHAHKCNVCQKTFPKLSLLERHLRIHSGEKPYICSYCNKGFAQNGTLQIHLSRHKGLKPFSCTLCEAKFNQKGNLRVHIQKTHLAAESGEKVYRCTMCTCVFKRVASLNAHITKAHANVSKASEEETDAINKVMEQLSKLEKRTNTGITETEKADIDGGTAPQQENIIEGDQVDKAVDEGAETSSSTDASYVKLADSSVDGVIRRYLVKQIKVGDSRFYVCWYCGRQFKKPSDLIRHIRIHTREKPFKCKQCNQSFSLKSTLVSHYNTHIGRRDYKCVICLKMFSSVRSLNTHIKKHYNKNQEPPEHYKCSMCNKTFNSSNKAKEHAHTHNGNNRRKTEEKEEIVMKQPMLETANGLLPIAAPKSKFPSVELEEFKNRPFRCHLCTAAFNKPVHLRRHLLRHSGDRRFKCDHCPKAFYNAYSLKEHKRFHSGVKNYTCRLCNKKFVTSTILKRHYATHSSYRPYICPYCKKRFTTVLLCRKHIKVHKKELLKSTETDVQRTSKLLPDVEKIETAGVAKDLVQTPVETYKPDSVIVSIAIDGCASKKVMELPLETTTAATDLGNSTSLLQDNVNSLLNPQFYQLPLDVQEFGVNEPVLESAVSDPVNNQVSLYINYDDLQTLNTNIYGQLLSQTPQLKLQNDNVLLNELPDTNGVFSLDNFAETQGFQENFNETVDLNMLLNKQVAGLTGDVSENSITYESGVEIIKCDQKKTVDKNTPVAADLNLQMELTNVQNSALPSFTSVCEAATVICISCGATIFLKDLESHDCTQKLPAVTIENVEKPNPDNKEEKPSSSTNSTSCVHCNKSFRNQKTYLKHMALHKHKKTATSHSCMYCQKVFKKPSDLKRHLRTHTGEKPFSCAKCLKSFSLKSTLEAHLRTHNPQGNKDFTCAVCNSCFSSKSSLKVHTALHTDAKPHACSYCDAKFRTAGHKKSHEQTHRKGKVGATKEAKMSNLLGPVAMDATVLGDKVMGEGAAAASDEIIFVQNPVTEEHTNIQNDNMINDSLNVLNQTIQIDAGLLQQLQSNGLLLQDSLDNDGILSDSLQLDSYSIKFPNIGTIATETSGENNEFKCDICGKNYSTKAILKKHRKIHGDEVEFRCSLCSKGFKNTLELERHNKIHLGVRPYSCHLCNNTFSEEGSMKTHMKRIHKINNVADMLLHYVEQDTDFIY